MNRTAMILIAALSAVHFGCSPTAPVPVKSSAPAAATPDIVVQPPDGKGRTGTFAVTVHNADRAAHVGFMVSTVFDGARSCYVLYEPGAEALFLVNDSGEGSQAVHMNSGITVENGQCSLSAADASISRTGTTLTLKIPLKFKPRFAGAKKLWGYTGDAGNVIGSWMVD